MKEIEFSRWLFELPAKQHSQFSPSISTFLPCLSLPSKSHRENSISLIFLESPHQVDMKIVVKCGKDFLSYFTTLQTYRVFKRPYIRHWLHFLLPSFNLNVYQAKRNSRAVGTGDARGSSPPAPDFGRNISETFSNFSYMFLNPNNFFQSEF